MFMGVLVVYHVCLAPCVFSACRCQERVSGPLGLVTVTGFRWFLVTTCVLVPIEEWSVPNPWAVSPALKICSSGQPLTGDPPPLPLCCSLPMCASTTGCFGSHFFFQGAMFWKEELQHVWSAFHLIKIWTYVTRCQCLIPFCLALRDDWERCKRPWGRANKSSSIDTFSLQDALNRLLL